MTRETNYRELGRAVFLAAIMVLSMVAMSATFAGAAAAQAGDVTTNRTTTTQTPVEPGDQVDIEVDVSASSSIIESYSEDIVDTNELTLVDAQASGNALVNSDDESFGVIYGSPTDQTTLTYTVEVDSNASDGTYEVGGQVLTSDGSTADSGTTQIEVNSSSGGGGPGPQPQPGSGPVTVDLGDLNTEPIFWHGQEVSIENIPAGDTVQIWESNQGGDRVSHVRDRTATGGTVTLNTGNLNADTWHIVRHGGTTYGPFFVSEQEIEVGFSADTTTTSTPVDLEWTDDNRGDTVDLVLSSDDLDNDDLAAAVTGASVVDGEVVVTDAEEGDSWEVNFADAGDYEITVEVFDTTASDTASVSVNDPEPGEAEFTEGVYQEEVGDVADFGLDTSGDISEVYIEMEDEHGVLDHTFSASGLDGGADISLNTFNTLQDPQAALSTSTEDVSLSQVSADSSNPSEQLKPSTVRLRLYDGEPGAGGTQVDRALIRLQEGSLDSAATWVAPGSADVTGDLGDLTDAATQRSSVAGGDYAVTQFEGSSLYGYMFDNGVFDPEDQSLSLSISDTSSPVYGSADSIEIGPGDDVSAMDGVWIRPDAANDQFFVVVDPDEFSEIESGETWDVSFSVGENNPYVGEDTSVSSSFTHTERSVSFTVAQNADDQYVVRGQDGASITGSSTAAPGTSVDVTAFFATEILDDSAEVGQDGTFSVSFDLGGYSDGEGFTMEATEDGEGVSTGEVDAVIGEPPSEPGAEAQFDVSAASPSSVALNNPAGVSYSFVNNGGQSGTVEYEVLVDGSVVDSGSMELGPGESTDAQGYSFDTSSSGDIEWEVNTQHDQRDGSTYVRPAEQEPPEASFNLAGSAPEEVTQGQRARISFSLTNTGGQSGSTSYTINVDGSEATSNSVALDAGESRTLTWSLPTTEAGDVSWEVSAAGQSIDGTLSVEAPPEPQTTGDEDDGDDDDGDDGGQPGFGLIVALFALIGAALLALRRQN